MKVKIILSFFLFVTWAIPAISKDPGSTWSEKAKEGPPTGEVITLSEGLRLVTQESRVIKIARGDEAIAEADVFKARSPLLPSLNGSLSHTSLAYQSAGLFSASTGTVAIPQEQ